MKENLYDILLSLFEKSLEQIKQKEVAQNEPDDEAANSNWANQLIHIKHAAPLSKRIIIEAERLKMTKASYQFISRMKKQNVLDALSFELLLNKIQFSDSRIVNLEETRWLMKEILVDRLEIRDSSFLYFILSQGEQAHLLH